jgi:chromosome partitioning protein
MIVAIANQKGGVGKTTTTIALGSLLSKHAPCLVVDLDPQGNLTTGLGIELEDGQDTICEVLADNKPISSTIIQTQWGMDLVPSDIGLARGERMLFVDYGSHLRLKQRLQAVSSKYAYILIDCPPSLGVLTISALTAADSVLIPVQCQYFAVMKGLFQFLETLEATKLMPGNEKLAILGILPTMADQTTMTRDSIEVLEQLSQQIPSLKIFSQVSRSVKFAESNQMGTPIDKYVKGRDAKILAPYQEIADCILQGVRV